MRHLPILAPVLVECALLFTAALSASPRLDATCGFIGNTYPGAKKWVQQDIEALAVLPDGTIFTNVVWDEAGGNVSQYKDGEVISTARHTHGWGAGGGKAVTANDKYLYFSMVMGNEGGGLKDSDTWPPKGLTWFGISRRLRRDITQAAPFPGGKGGKGDTLKSCFLPINELAGKDPDGQIAGLAVDTAHLYVSNPVTDEILLLDPETLQRQGAWKLQRPGPVALSPDHRLYVLQFTTPRQIQRMNPDGQPDGKPIQLPATVNPTALCFHPKGQLYVADSGPAQQILVFNPKDGKAGKPIGIAGGIFAAPVAGKVGPLRFNHLSAIGCDAAGDLIVAHHGSTGGGSTVLESYSPDLKRNWQLLGLTFVDMAETDPADETQVYTKEEHFTYHPGSPATYEGYTVNSFKFPDDPRIHLWSAGAWVRRIGGHPILFVQDMNAGYLQVYRFDPETDGEIAIPSGFIAQRHLEKKSGPAWPPHQPEKGEWIWRDRNGNGSFDPGEYTSRGSEDCPAAQGWCVTPSGDIWLATETHGIRKFACQGLDAHGNPQWDYAHMQTFPPPDEFDSIKRLRYLPEIDTMILGGVKGPDKNQHWKPMGPVLCCYPHWGQPDRKLRWRSVVPCVQGSSGHESCEPMGFDIAGDFLFLPYTGASKQNGFKTGHIEVLRLGDGTSVGYLEPGPDVGEVGLQDLRECLTARKLRDGSYLILLEDDYKSKVLAYHWKP